MEKWTRETLSEDLSLIRSLFRILNKLQNKSTLHNIISINRITIEYYSYVPQWLCPCSFPSWWPWMEHRYNTQTSPSGSLPLSSCHLRCWWLWERPWNLFHTGILLFRLIQIPVSTIIQNTLNLKVQFDPFVIYSTHSRMIPNVCEYENNKSGVISRPGI